MWPWPTPSFIPSGILIHPAIWTHTHTTILWPFFWDHPSEPVAENFWALWCKGRLTEADTLTILLGATPSRLTSAYLHHPEFFTGRMPFLPPIQQCQSTEDNWHIRVREKTLEFSSTVLPAPSPYLFVPVVGHNRHGPKIGGSVPFFGVGSWVPI